MLSNGMVIILALIAFQLDLAVLHGNRLGMSSRSLSMALHGARIVKNGTAQAGFTSVNLRSIASLSPVEKTPVYTKNW